ncbi:MAG: GNAT family N-acetyltransferase [Desulfobulbaceae bacterium]|nr:MAG: GNAT family N-acetyltransferase [Desulfobulbaceae bacterium]
MFTVDQMLAEHYPEMNNRRLIATIVKPILKILLHEKAFIEFSNDYPELKGIEFIEQVLEYFQFNCSVCERQKENIPASGATVLIANHPIGSLDGIALLKLVHSIRPDVKIVANDLLMSITPLSEFLLPVRNMTRTSQKFHIKKISHALESGEVVIWFPAGEVSRFGLNGVRDGKWQQGFLKIAERAKAPILPVHIKGRNSTPFYLTSLLAKPLSTPMLVGEMFRQQKKGIRVSIGKLIPHRSYKNLPINRIEKIKLFKKHLYRLGSKKPELFETESSIGIPERKANIKSELKNGQSLVKTPDDKTIYFFEKLQDSAVIREIGRLRELTFRAVGEGTGKRRDIDRFDRHYHHLVLWDDDDLEIAGAYRFIDVEKTVAQRGTKGLYTCSLFNLDPERCYFFKNGLEIGRSFVQQKYWGNRSLDYLWYGFGAYIRENPHYRYLFGPVSISNDMPTLAKELLIYFYKLYFSDQSSGSYSLNPFQFSQPQSTLQDQFSGNDYRADFKKLKNLLANLGSSVPTLYKQYTELCEPGGVKFLDFNVDPDFNNCVDGLVIVDTHMLKERKRKRYLEGNQKTATA